MNYRHDARSCTKFSAKGKTVTKEKLNDLIMYANRTASEAETQSEGSVDGNKVFLDIMFDRLQSEFNLDVRDKFAVAIIQGSFACQSDDKGMFKLENFEKYADEAYAFADIMLKARAKLRTTTAV